MIEFFHCLIKNLEVTWHTKFLYCAHQ